MANSLGKATVLMAAGTLSSRVLGFVKAILLAYAIGQTASVSADAFNIANSLPNLVFVLLMGGMLNAVLVPQIVQAAKSEDGGAAYINKLLTLVLVCLTAITLLAMAFAPFLIWTNAVAATPEQLALATAFAYWALPQVLFYGLFLVLGEVLNAKNVFGPYAWAPALNNVISIIGIVLFLVLFGADPDGQRQANSWQLLPIAVLAGSATLGVVCQALILLVFWCRAGIKYRPDFIWRGVGLGATAKLSLWSFGMIVVMQAAWLLLTNVVYTASGTGAAAAAFNNGWLILMLPHSVLVVSLATAYFTRFAEYAAVKNKPAFVADYATAMRQVLVLVTYTTVVLLCAAPFLSRLMQLGASAHLLADFTLVLQAFVLFTAVPYSLFFITQRAFYALSDTRTPFFIMTVQLAVLVVLSIGILFAVPLSLRAAAAAAAFGVATLAQVLCAVWLLSKKLGTFPLTAILSTLRKTTVAGVFAFVCCYPLALWATAHNPQLPVPYSFFCALGCALLSLAVYVLLLRLQKSNELLEVSNALRQKLRRG